jgi:urease accessory protein
MLRATAIVRRLAVKRDKVVDRVVLDHAARRQRHATLTGEGGLALLLDLEKDAVLDDGDALRLEDGRLIEVKAAPQRLVEITTGSPERLLRLAWQIGNRHAPAEIAGSAIYIEDDSALVETVRSLGAATRIVERPFRPERGASRHEAHDHHGHSHDHDSHDHHSGDHAHHGHDHAGHDHGHDHGHVHDEHCGHGHAHGKPHHDH